MKDELVIRWLSEPISAPCAICRSKKPKDFEKGPVVSLVGGGLVCSRCAAKEHPELHGVCAGYRTSIDQFSSIDRLSDLKLDDMPKLELDDISKSEPDDIKPLETNLEDIYPSKCNRCAHEFSLKDAK